LAKVRAKAEQARQHGDPEKEVAAQRVPITDVESDVMKDKDGIPKQFIVHRYTTTEPKTDQTAQINKQRAKEADEQFRRALPQLGFLRRVMSMKMAPRVVRPSNYTLSPKGTFKVQYITSKGLLKYHTPKQILRFLEMKGHKFGEKTAQKSDTNP
jgi:hypothetical protein